MSDTDCAQLNFTSPGWMRLSRNLMRSRNSPSSSSSRAPIILSQITTTKCSQVHILQSSSLTGQTKGLFYSVLILYSSSLTEQFKGLYYAVLLLYSSLLIIPHRANQLAFSTLSFYFTHHPSQGKSTNLFYSVLLLYSSSLRGQINWPFLLCPYTLIIVSHRANQPAFSTLSLPFPTPTIRQCMPLSNSYHQRLHHVCFRFQSFSLCSKYCHLLTTVSKDF